MRARRKARVSPPPKGLAFALVEGGPKGLRLYAVNATARSFGLTRGQRLADARAAMPDLLTEQAEPEKDVASLIGLCRWLERYSPWVQLDGQDGALLDATGVPHLFGGEDAMHADIMKRLGDYGFTARAAFGETIGAAWAMARYGPAEINTLPIEALRIDANSARTLRRLGLKTIGALSILPRASLARRFRGETIHENVLLRLDELQGHRHEPLTPLNPPSSFMAHRALMEPVITHEGLIAILNGLTAALTRDLQRQNQGASRLILKLFRSDGTRTQIPAGLSAPSHDMQHLLRLLTPKLETLDAGFGIDAMTLEARETGTVDIRQYGFMEDTGDKTLAELNDRMMNRQETEMATLTAMASHIPERAEALQALDQVEGHLPNKLGRGNPFRSPNLLGELPEGLRGGRPLMILEPPEPASVIASVPDGPPMRLTWRRVARRIVKSAGPERIAPEWWRAERGGRPRDYYSIEDDEGRRYWIYRDGLYGEDSGTPKWFVHGLSP